MIDEVNVSFFVVWYICPSCVYIVGNVQTFQAQYCTGPELS